MSTALQPISYKDPAGFVLKKENGYYRYVSHEYAGAFEHFIQSGLYQILVDQNLLVPHLEVKQNIHSKDYYTILFPEQIPLTSYPYEWTYSQWQEMAINYLKINTIALEHGMILKDASPYNFAFYKGKCLLLDTTSFTFYSNGKPWIAYRQFCEEILSPLALMHYKDSSWAGLYSSHISGLPLSFVSKELPLKTWLNSSCLLHIHLHARFQKKKKRNIHSGTGFTQEKLITLLQLLRKNIIAWQCPLSNYSIWNNYYKNDIADERYLNDKTNIISEWLSKLQPFVAIDIGANTGKFSFIAAGLCKQVIAVENDLVCVEKIQEQIKEKEYKNITTIVADITEPSPGLGWENKEKKALLERLAGDMVMMLAIVHHLCISKNVPLQFIPKLAASITTRYAIIEFIPKEDSKVKLLLANREDIFRDYTEENFIKNFQNYFKLIQIHQCEASSRKLFLWEKK